MGGPIDESLELIAMAPAELEEFYGVEIRGFLTKKGFETPPDIRATPRCAAISARGNPVITHRSKHSCTSLGTGVTSLGDLRVEARRIFRRFVQTVQTVGQRHRRECLCDGSTIVTGFM